MKVLRNWIIHRKHKKPIVLDVFYREDNKQKPIVIFCHGYKGFKDWGAWDLMAEHFAEQGFCFIKFNFSHNGGTIEQPIDFPDLEAFGQNNYTKELDDLEGVIDWVHSKQELKSNINLNQITLIGHSRGGGIVLIKASEDKRISSVITLASVCDYSKRSPISGDLNQWKKDGVKYVLNGRTKQQMPHYYQFYESFLENKDRLSIQSAVERLNIPTLLIHGSDDAAVFVEEAKNLHQWNSKSKLHIIEGANHVFGAKHPWENERLPNDLKIVVTKSIDFLKSV